MVSTNDKKTNVKNKITAEISKDDRDDNQWDFTSIQPKLNNKEPKNFQQFQITDSNSIKKKSQNTELELDNASVPKPKSRTTMANEIYEKNQVIDDIYNYASPIRRGVALLIDLLFSFGLSILVYTSAPLSRKLIQIYIDKYNLQLLLPESITLKLIIAINGFLIAFFFIIIPLSFYNSSLGKKLIGISVRGTNSYTISISQAILRELIMKPISILIAVGFVTPFFTKKKQSIHDMLSETIVIVAE